MKALHFRCLIAAIGLALSPSPAWADETSAINGQVFIVTKGAETYKLALVHVAVFPEETFTKFIAKKREAAKPLKEPLAKIAASATEAFEQAKAAMAKDIKLAEASIEAAVSLSEALARRDYLDSAIYLFEGLPAPVAEAPTDADGKFSLKVPPGRYVVCARASRLAGENGEDYSWLVRVSVDAAKPAQTVLNNENLTSSGGAASVVKTISAAREHSVIAKMTGEGFDSLDAFIEAKAREIEAKKKPRADKHRLAQTELKRDWRIPQDARFSTLSDADDEFTVCHERANGFWESRGVVEFPARSGESPARLPWRMIYLPHDDGSIETLFSQIGNRQKGDTSLFPP